MRYSRIVIEFVFSLASLYVFKFYNTHISLSGHLRLNRTPGVKDESVKSQKKFHSFSSIYKTANAELQVMEKIY